MKNKTYYIYIITNKRNGTLYVGITNNIIRRATEHKHKHKKSFTSKYGLNKLVYYETHPEINNALEREKEIKRWNRQWKIELIEKNNPIWEDLYNYLL